MTQSQPSRLAPDLSTLNEAELKKLSVYSLPPSYHLQRDCGNGCFLDPPGFPSYFTRGVFTQHGNAPRRGVEEVISFGGALYTTRSSADWKSSDTWDGVYGRYSSRLMRLWSKLSFEHPRTQLWIAQVHQHLRHAYVDDAQLAEPLENGKPAMVFFPVPSHKLRRFVDDARFSADWRSKEQAAVEAFNVSVHDRYAKVATIDNHAAVRRIRRFYPEYAPNEAAIVAAEEAPRLGDWWQRHAERPSPSECRPPQWFGEHRTNGWCQFCGYVTAAPEAVAQALA